MQLLAEAHARIEGFLASFPRNLTEARQKIARDLWPDPRPEELQAIFRIAADTARSGPRRELPRQILALRYRSRIEMHAYWGLRDLRGDRVRTLCENLRILAAAVVQFHRAAESILVPSDDVSTDDREYLRQVIPPLLPDRGELASAATLAPILLELSDLLAGRGEGEGLPNLGPEETALLDRFSPTGAGARDLDRQGVEALALRWQVERDLEAWEQAEGEEDEALARRLRIDLATYRALSDRLQRQQDAALAAHQSEVVAELDTYRRSLFSSFQRLAPVVRGQGKLGDESRSESAAPVRPTTRRTLNQEQLEEDSVIEAAREHAFHEAVSGAGATPASLPGDQRARHRSRLPWLVATLVVLLGALAAVYLFLPQGPPPRIETSPADYAAALPLTETQSIGTLLHARVNESWASLTETQRVSRLEELGRLASRKGFAAVHLVGPAGRTLAEWTTTGGATLHAPTPETPRP
jgi:hypothetical protein